MGRRGTRCTLNRILYSAAYSHVITVPRRSEMRIETKDRALGMTTVDVVVCVCERAHVPAVLHTDNDDDDAAAAAIVRGFPQSNDRFQIFMRTITTRLQRL